MSARFNDVPGHGRCDVDASLKAFSSLANLSLSQIIKRYFPILDSIFTTLPLRLRFGGQISSVEDEDGLYVEVKQHVKILHHVGDVTIRGLVLESTRTPNYDGNSLIQNDDSTSSEINKLGLNLMKPSFPQFYMDNLVRCKT